MKLHYDTINESLDNPKALSFETKEARAEWVRNTVANPNGYVYLLVVEREKWRPSLIFRHESEALLALIDTQATMHLFEFRTIEEAYSKHSELYND